MFICKHKQEITEMFTQPTSRPVGSIGWDVHLCVFVSVCPPSCELGEEHMENEEERKKESEKEMEWDY